MYFMPKVNLLKEIENYEEVIDMVDKIFHLSTNNSAVENVVMKITKPDINTALENIHKSFKETMNSEGVEIRLFQQHDSENINLDGYHYHISRYAIQILLECLRSKYFQYSPNTLLKDIL